MDEGARTRRREDEDGSRCGEEIGTRTETETETARERDRERAQREECEMCRWTVRCVAVNRQGAHGCSGGRAGAGCVSTHTEAHTETPHTQTAHVNTIPRPATPNS
eukprot:3723707-Rhodomonas_salina.2